MRLYLKAVPHPEEHTEAQPMSEKVLAAETLESMNDFLSKLTMKVWNGADKTAEPIFTGAPNAAFGAVELGRVNKGGTAALTVELAVPLDLGNEYMNRVAEATFSTFDTGRNPSDDTNPERFYHGFVLGLIVELAGKYRVASNRESGFGRYDVMLEPLEKTKDAFVLEFKVFNPRKEKTLEDTNALQQINEKDYDCELLSRGIQKENIFHYGFAFEGKKVLIGLFGEQSPCPPIVYVVK